MYDKLENLLNSWVGPERRELIMNAITVLDKYNYMNAWTEISAYLEYATDESTAMIIDTLEGILTVGLDAVVRAHAVRYEGTIRQKTIVLEGLLALQNFEDKESILTLIDSGNDYIHILADLIEFATTVPWVEIIDGIKDVSPSLIDKIVQVNTDEEKIEGNSYVMIDPERKENIVKFFQTHPKLLGRDSIVKEMRPVGVPIAILIDAYKLNLHLLEPEAPDQAAAEIVGLALVSDIPMKDIVKGAKDQIEILYADMGFITKVDVAMDKYLTEIAHHG